MQVNEKSMKILTTILIALIVVVLIFGFNISNSLSSISRRIDDISNQVYNPNTTSVNYNQIEDIIAGQLENENYLGVQPFFDTEYSDGKIALECNFILSEAKIDDILQIMYRKTRDGDWEPQTLTQTSTLNYSTEILLDLFSEYEYYIVKTGSLSQSSRIVGVPWEYSLSSANFAHGTEIESSNGKDVTAYVFLSKPKTLIKGLEFSYRLDLYAGDQLIDSMDVEAINSIERIELSLDIDGVLIDRIVATMIINSMEYENEIYNRHDNEKEHEVAP